jgi:hypothetical protein
VEHLLDVLDAVLAASGELDRGLAVAGDRRAGDPLDAAEPLRGTDDSTGTGVGEFHLGADTTSRHTHCLPVTAENDTEDDSEVYTGSPRPRIE